MKAHSLTVLFGLGCMTLQGACGGSSDPVPLPDEGGDGDATGDGDGAVEGDGDVGGDGDGAAGDGDGAAGDGDVGAGDGDDSGSESGFGREVLGGGTRSGFAVMDLTIGGEQYYVNTNPWGGATQTITAGGENIFVVDQMTAPSGGNAWDVAAFPSVFKGASYGGDHTADSGMPVQVGSIASVRTGMMTNASAISYKGNTTYDVYFTESEDYNVGGEGPPDRYLMVWFHSNAINPINGDGEGWTCSSQPPTNIEACTGAGSVQIGGKTFHRFIGPNGNSRVISYAPETTFDVWEFELVDFIDDAVAQGVLTDQMYLQSVQGGFELIEGGAGLAIQDYYVDVNP